MDKSYGSNPATATDDIEDILGEVQETPTANTVLDRLKDLLTEIVLATGSNVVGKVGIDQTTDETTNKVRSLGIPNTTLVQGNVTLDGTAQQLDSDTSCKNVTIQAHPDNAGYVYVGNSSVSASVHMAVLSAGSSMSFTVNNLNLLYVKGTTSDLVSYGGEV